MAKKQEKEVERWVTVNGARVPIFKDGSIGGPKELRDKLKKMDSFEKSQKGLYTNTSNAKEQVDMLKAELKKHSNDIHTNEIKARLKKAEDRYKKLKKGEDPDKDVFKTKKEWDEEDKKKASQKDKKKETNGETKHYSVYQPKNILGDETHTRLERIEAKSESEAVAKYKEKYPKASDENIGISRTTKEGGRYQNPDGSWDDGHMYKNSKKTSTSKTPEFKNAEEAEKYYQEKFNNVSSTYANKLATQMGIEGRGKEKRAALAKAYTEKWKQSQNISNNEDLKEKQIARNKVEKNEINKQQKDTSTKTPQAKEFGVESSIKDYADLKEAYNKKMSGDGYKVVSNNAGFIGDYVTTPSGDKYTIIKSSWKDAYYIYKGRGYTDEKPTTLTFGSSKEALEWLKNNDTGAKSKNKEFDDWYASTSSRDKKIYNQNKKLLEKMIAERGTKTRAGDVRIMIDFDKFAGSNNKVLAMLRREGYEILSNDGETVYIKKKR